MTSGPGTPAEPPAEPAPQPPRRMRCSDADRAVVIGRLQDALGRGLLTFDEAGERISAAHAAKFVDELGPLSGDLPAPPPTAPTTAGAVGWRRIGESLVAQVRSDVHSTTSSGARSRRAVLTVVALVVLLALFIAMVSAAAHGFDGPQHFHGPGGFNGPGAFDGPGH